MGAELRRRKQRDAEGNPCFLSCLQTEHSERRRNELPARIDKAGKLELFYSTPSASSSKGKMSIVIRYSIVI